MSRAKFVDWRAITPSPIVLVVGSEEYFSQSAIRNLKNRLKQTEASLEIYEIESSEYQSGDLLNMASPSLFSDPKLIVFNAMERSADALIEDAKSLQIEDLIETTIVFQHSGTSTKAKALLDYLRGLSGVIEVNCAKLQKDAEKIAFIQTQFTSNNRKVTNTAAKAILDAFGTDTAEMAAACDQLLADSTETIDEDIVDKYFGGRVETTGYKIFDVAIENRGGDALLLLRHALQTGQDLVPLVSAFGIKIRQLARLHSDPKATMESVGMADWVFRKVKKQASAWDDDALSKALLLLADADAAAKGAEREPEYRLEQLILYIANRGRA